MSIGLITTGEAAPGANVGNWLDNVMMALKSGYGGTLTIWTDGWSIPKDKEISDIRVYANNELMIAGKFRSQKKDTVYTVFKDYRDSNLRALGLKENASGLQDFIDALNVKYPGEHISGDTQVDCIVFLPVAINDKWHDYLSAEKGSPLSIKKISDKGLESKPPVALDEKSMVFTD